MATKTSRRAATRTLHKSLDPLFGAKNFEAVESTLKRAKIRERNGRAIQRFVTKVCGKAYSANVDEFDTIITDKRGRTVLVETHTSPIVKLVGN
jgi:hypothetical protein